MLAKTIKRLLFLIVILGLLSLVIWKIFISADSFEKRFSTIYRMEFLSEDSYNLKIGDSLFTFNDSLTNINRQTVSFNDILKDVNLVFLVSQYNCQACVDRKIEVLNKLFSNENNIHIVVIIMNYKYRDFLIFKNAHPTKFPIYNLKRNFNNSLEGSIDPAFFLISKDAEIIEIHVTDKDHPDETLLFLKSLIE